LRKALCLMLLASVFSCCPAFGDELKLIPSVTVREEYNDNIFLSVSDVKSDFRSILSPAVELTERNERLDASLSLRLNGFLYARNSELDALDQQYQGRLRFVVSPRMNLSSTAAYILDSQPDREVETTGLVLGLVKRHRQMYSLSGERALTEKTSASLAYSYEQDDYVSPQFTDLKWHNAELSLVHNLDRFMRSTRASMDLGYAHYGFSGSDVDNFSVSVGLGSDLNEVWSVQASVGGRYTVSEFETLQPQFVPPFFFVLVPVKDTSREWGWVGQLALSYRGETTSGNLAFASNVMPASGQSSGTTIRTSLVADARRRLTYELSAGMAVGYYLNKSNPGAFAGQKIDDQTLLVTPNLRYEFSRDMFIEASYQYTKVWQNVSRTEVDRNMVFVTFSLRHPFFL
jgi:hypothetical protein